MESLTWQKRLLLVIFLGLVAVSLLSPISSNLYLPGSLDYANHTAGIVQAKMALDEGQFPIRVAPWQDQGWRHAFFQFYSPFPYTVAGMIYKYVTNNPFIAFKTTIWLFLLFSGVYIFQLMRWLTRSNHVAILSSVVYMTAPYYLININIRGDFTEAVAQGVIPVVIYYTLRCYIESSSLRWIFLTSAAWFVLITSHVITFVYTSFFMGVFLLFLTVKNISLWKKLSVVGFAYGYGCLLALWYLLPIAILKKYFFISSTGLLISPFNHNELTPLSKILAVAAVSNKLLSGPMAVLNFTFAVGWPILIAIGFLFYLLIQKNDLDNWFIGTLLALFCVILFAVWSPVNFWRFLPTILSVAQYSYRLLAQVIWVGVILFGFAILGIFRESLDNRYVTVGLLLVGIASSSWIAVHNVGNQNVNTLKNVPTLGYGQDAFLINQKTFPTVFFAGNSQLPLIDDYHWLSKTPQITKYHWLKINEVIKLPVSLLVNAPNATLKLLGSVPAELVHKPVVLTLLIDEKMKIRKTIMPGNFEWDIPLGSLTLAKNKEFSLQFLLDDDITQKNDKSTMFEMLGVTVSSLNLAHLSSISSVMPVLLTQPNCAQNKTKTNCHIVVSPEVSWVQLPVFYYPDLLQVRVNGKQVSYFPLGYEDFVLVGLKLQPGFYDISVEFKGIVWANWLSGLAWLILFVGMIFAFYIDNVLKYKKTFRKSGKTERFSIFRGDV